MSLLQELSQKANKKFKVTVRYDGSKIHDFTVAAVRDAIHARRMMKDRADYKELNNPEIIKVAELKETRVHLSDAEKEARNLYNKLRAKNNVKKSVELGAKEMDVSEREFRELIGMDEYKSVTADLDDVDVIERDPHDRAAQIANIRRQKAERMFKMKEAADDSDDLEEPRVIAKAGDFQVLLLDGEQVMLQNIKARKDLAQMPLVIWKQLTRAL